MDRKTERDVLGEWECMECGYIEEGVETRPPQSCPDCHAPVEALEFFPYGDDEGEDDRADDSFEELHEDDEPLSEE